MPYSPEKRNQEAAPADQLPSSAGRRFSALLRRKTLPVLVAGLLLLLWGQQSVMADQTGTLLVLVRRLVSLVSFPIVLRILAGLGVLCSLGVFGLLGLAGVVVRTLTRPRRQAPVSTLTPALLGWPAEAISFPVTVGSCSYPVPGYYCPQPGAQSIVIVSPGYRRPVEDVLLICRALWQAGHHVLAFEYLGHGRPLPAGVSLPLTLGYREVKDFLAAVRYAQGRAPGCRIGALGFSMGGAVSLLGAACCPEVAAVAADSAFATQWQAVEHVVRQRLRLPPRWVDWLLPPLYWMSNRLLRWHAGYRFEQVEPVQAIAQIAPRPVLLIHGQQDRLIPAAAAQQRRAAARPPKARWLVPGVEHVRACLHVPDRSVARLTAFFQQALLPDRPARPLQVAAGSSVVAGSQGQEKAPVRVSRANPPKREQDQSSPPGFRLGLVWGRWLVRWRWRVAGAWLLVLLISLPLAQTVGAVLRPGGTTVPGGETAQVQAVLRQRLHQPATQLFAVLSVSPQQARSRSFAQQQQAVVARARSLPHVLTIQAQVSPNGQTALVILGLDEDSDLVAALVPELQARLEAIPGPAHLQLTGEAAVATALQQATQEDTARAEALALPLTLAALLLVFDGLLASLLPVGLAGLTLITTLAGLALLGRLFPLQSLTESLVGIIGLGLAIDYSLLLIRRFREELARTRAGAEAVAETMATAGEAIACSACLVTLGFGALLLIPIPFVRSLGAGGCLVTGVAALAALTLLPALLSLLGPRINALAVSALLPWRWQRWRGLGPVRRQDPASVSAPPEAVRLVSWWERWAWTVMRHPLPLLGGALALLLLVSWPALALRPGLPGAAVLPADAPARQGWEELRRAFPTVDPAPILVVVQPTAPRSMQSAADRIRVMRLVSWIERLPHVSGVDLPRDHAPQPSPGGAMLLLVHTDSTPDSPEEAQPLDQLHVVPASPREGLHLQIGGPRAQTLEFDRTLYRASELALLFLLAGTALLLLVMVTFRSLLLPLKAILMNLLSLGSAFGALVWVFQDGHGATWLGFTPTGSLDRFVPIVLGCTLFGLSMDYDVFLLSRVRECWRRGRNNEQAVAEGLARTGGMITSAACLFLLVERAGLRHLRGHRPGRLPDPPPGGASDHALAGAVELVAAGSTELGTAVQGSRSDSARRSPPLQTASLWAALVSLALQSKRVPGAAGLGGVADQAGGPDTPWLSCPPDSTEPLLHLRGRFALPGTVAATYQPAARGHPDDGRSADLSQACRTRSPGTAAAAPAGRAENRSSCPVSQPARSGKHATGVMSTGPGCRCGALVLPLIRRGGTDHSRAKSRRPRQEGGLM
ncbi:MAG: MMPL family transporter [Thermogemmatispora sp.]|nr:MMPL family transporter [Thermogemmatispora sp.]MBX5449371.1 MMPL family transporter [Thermogemmatispora sp.]